MNNEETKRKKKRGYKLKSLKVRKQAVEEYLAWDIPIPELAKKYNIAIGTLYNWIKELKVELVSGRVRYPKELRLRVVKEIITGTLNEKEATLKYGLKRTTVHGWCVKYSSQISESTTKPMALKKQKEESEGESERIRKLEKALEDANLKIIGLETMINVAEEELRIDIRKKPGTKQSK